MAQVTIYVPDDLAEELRRVRLAGVKVNVSTLCAEALRDAVASVKDRRKRQEERMAQT